MTELVPIAQHLPDTAAQARIAGYIQQSKAAATVKAYQTDWRLFAAWCAERGAEPGPPTAPLLLADYLTTLADDGAAARTIQRKAAAVAYAHHLARQPDPTKDPGVKECMAGIRRQVGMAAKQARPVLIADLRAMVMRLPNTLAGTRDRALLLLGFAGALRRSELVGLRLADVEEMDDGLRLTLWHTKTDKENAGQYVGIPRGEHLETCPVRAWLSWLDAAGITEGPAFRAIDKHGHVAEEALTGRSFSRIIKAAVAAAGMNSKQFSGHSLRAGLVTQAHKNGVDLASIAAQTRHKRLDTLNIYIRQQVLGKGNAARKVGL
jgi:site-specific recombinase XerD